LTTVGIGIILLIIGLIIIGTGGIWLITRRRKERTKEASSLSAVSMEIMSNRQQKEEDDRFTPKKVLIYCLIVGLSSAILSILIDGLRLLSMAAFVFASITIWYIFGEKFHNWQERKKEQKHV
jgi:Flp pilus assembly protein TadB